MRRSPSNALARRDAPELGVLPGEPPCRGNAPGRARPAQRRHGRPAACAAATAGQGNRPDRSPAADADKRWRAAPRPAPRVAPPSWRRAAGELRDRGLRTRANGGRLERPRAQAKRLRASAQPFWSCSRAFWLAECTSSRRPRWPAGPGPSIPSGSALCSCRIRGRQPTDHTLSRRLRQGLAAAPDRDRHVDDDRPAVVAELHLDHAAIRSGSCRRSAFIGLLIPRPAAGS